MPSFTSSYIAMPMPAFIKHSRANPPLHNSTGATPHFTYFVLFEREEEPFPEHGAVAAAANLWRQGRRNYMTAGVLQDSRGQILM